MRTGADAVWTNPRPSNGAFSPAARPASPREQIGTTVPIHLAAQERGGVHQAEGGVGQHPGLLSRTVPPATPQHPDPLLDVEPLQPADLAAWLIRQPVQLMQVQRDHGGVVQREVDVEVDQRASAPLGPAAPATRSRPPASRPSLTGLSAAASIASLPAKW